MTEIIHFFESVGGKIVGFLAAVFALKKLYDMLRKYLKKILMECVQEANKPLVERFDGFEKKITDLQLADKDLLPRKEAYENLQSVAVCKATHRENGNAQSTVQERNEA